MARLRITRADIIVLVLLAIVFICAFAWFTRGLHVSLANGGVDRLEGVTVHVSGKKYSVGDLQPGESKTIEITYTVESGIKLHFTTASGVTRQLLVDVYLGQNYQGTIYVEMTSEKILRVGNTAGILPWD